MPTALNKDGYRFYFYSNDHAPMHVHVQYGSGSAKFDISVDAVLLEAKGMKVSELRIAQNLIEENIELLRRKWNEFFS